MLLFNSLLLATALTQLKKYFDFIKINISGFKPVKCIECKKNKHEVEGFQIVLEVVLVSVQITYPFHENEISWLFYNFFICFISFYIIFMKAQFFRVNLCFQKEKTLKKRCVYNHGKFHYKQITLHSPDFAGDKNVAFDFSDTCLFGHPVYFD